MQQITVRLPERTLAEVDREAAKAGASRSEYIREVLASRDDSPEHEQEVEGLRTEVDRLRRQLAAANSRIDASNELVRAVEREQSLAERKAQAGLVTRAKWWLTGMPSSSSEAARVTEPEADPEPTASGRTRTRR
ncbi:ribbon-helix-helix domain-containing protein [Halomarina pelagica]|uniref:ribbon-helix-helix domain-containing protein n=1 Tax=Halomarina pelagica TaxID=2961599 RepID=UPI0020C274A7|nr:ribbon-helix-helix domain-containing protein [Halomarina sp. BND7]